MSALNIAEIPYENGRIYFRYSRYLSDDGARWIRHGLFRTYHTNGSVASVGEYMDGDECGLWRDFHENGQLVAEGFYENGVEIGAWKYWNEDGSIVEGQLMEIC